MVCKDYLIRKDIQFDIEKSVYTNSCHHSIVFGKHSPCTHGVWDYIKAEKKISREV